MESLTTMTAVALTTEVAGETCRLTPLTLADYGEIERAMRQEHDAGGHDLAAPAIWANELSAWMSSRDGLAYVLWLAVRECQPHLTLDRCRQLVAAEQDLERLERQLDLVNGLPAGNCRGQARQFRRHRPAA